MTKITEAEFERICQGIYDDRESIIKHNSIGTDEEILLWMLLAVLSSYLNLEDNEMPCFTGKPDAETYGQAIRFVLSSRMASDFEPDVHLRILR